MDKYALLTKRDVKKAEYGPSSFSFFSVIIIWAETRLLQTLKKNETNIQSS